MKTDLGVYTYLDASTTHITKRDERLLSSNDAGDVIFYKYAEGFFICVPPADFAEDVGYFGNLSKSFKQLFKKASDSGCYLIRLDPDGFVHDDLKKYDW